MNGLIQKFGAQKASAATGAPGEGCNVPAQMQQANAAAMYQLRVNGLTSPGLAPNTTGCCPPPVVLDASSRDSSGAQLTVGANDVFSVTVQLQEPFKGNDFVVAAQIAQYFEIMSIKVGRDEQLISEAAIPAEVFSSASQRQVGLDMLPCPTSKQIFVQVRNVDTQARYFKAAFFGSCFDCNTPQIGG
jgi:hypothetical protein